MNKYPETKVENGRVMCPKCDKNYACRDGFVRHYKKHHMDSTPKKEGVLEEFGITKGQLRKILVAKKSKDIKPLEIKAGKKYTFGAIADTHLCSVEEKKEALHAFYKICEQREVKDVYHAGDLVAGQGIYHGQEYEIHTFGADNQAKYVIDCYPKVRGIKTHFILGNHDYIYYKKIGVDIGDKISKEREDMNYLGRFSANITIGGVKFIQIVHPDSGMPYALSYRAQKFVEQIHSGTKPNIILFGHLHTQYHFFYRNIAVFGCGAFEGQTTYILRKGINPVIGGWIITVEIADDPKRSIISITPEFIPFFC